DCDISVRITAYPREFVRQEGGTWRGELLRSACGPREESGVPNAAAALGCRSESSSAAARASGGGVPASSNEAPAARARRASLRAPQRERAGVGSPRAVMKERVCEL